MELEYSFASLVPLHGMNGVIAQKTKKNLKTYALKMKAVHSFEFTAQTFSNIRRNNPKKGVLKCG
jgi:hypothetical protein